LNQTDSDKEVFASVYRDPEFINRFVKNTELGVTEWAYLAVAIVCFTGIIYLLIKVRKLSIAILIMQSQLTMAVKALDELHLTQRPRPTEPT